MRGHTAAGNLLVLAALLAFAWAAERPVVTLSQGQLKGKVIKTYSNKDMFSFFGIPYAKPPVGELRFKAPEPAGPWKGIYDAGKNRSRCAQLRYPEMRFIGEEDCLFINVYSTKLPTQKEDKLAPVIFYIHGGLFVHSAGDFDRYNPFLLLDGEPGELVFVTFNYRLGPLGFLSTEDAECPGNFGLKDQVMALKWVKENIAAFGGDPDKVTLMGDNAGAASAHLHMMSPLSKGLFKYAISQSGNAMTHWIWSRDAFGRAQRLAELLECGDNTTSPHHFLKCMRSKSAEDIVRKSNIVIKWRTDWIVSFTPSIEDFNMPEGTAFITEHPRELMQKNNFYPVPWLIGVTSHDGLPHSLNLLLFRGIAADLNNEFEKYAPYYFEMEGELEYAMEAAKLIKEFYFKGAGIGMGSQTQLAEMHTDYYYFMSLIKSAALHVMADAPPVYAYHFSYQNRNSRIALGVPQGDDTQYILPKEEGGRLIPKQGSDEMKVANRLISIIKNFVNTGEPIAKDDNSYDGVTWLPVDSKKMNFIDFNKKMTLNTTFYPERVAFWNDMEDLITTGRSVLKDGPVEPAAKEEL